jgi:CheY-like chemotaxis protein
MIYTSLFRHLSRWREPGDWPVRLGIVSRRSRVSMALAGHLEFVRIHAIGVEVLRPPGALFRCGRNEAVQDVKLPKIDGLEVLRRLRANEQARLLPLVILASSNEDQDRINSYRLRANSHVRKPVGFEQFVEAVWQLGLCWLILNEPAQTAVRRIA